MPITKTTGYKASDGQVYATVEEAQTKEIERLFIVVDNAPDSGGWTAEEIASTIVSELRDNLLDILTTGPRSRPSTRKKAGTTAPKRARARAATVTEVGERFKAMREAVDPDDATLSRTCLRGGADTEVALETGR